MRIPSNHVKSIVRFFQDELGWSYSSEEIENFIFYTFNHFLGFSRTDISLKAETTVTESELLKFNDVVKRLKKKEPIQYILGEAWFYGLRLNVNNHVLIPRPETEELVDRVIKDVKVKQSGSEELNIIDVCTGSGCIAIALKKNLAFANIFALDVSIEALKVAEHNAILQKTKLNFIQADILTPVKEIDDIKFDIIVSNPPYVLETEKEAMDKNVLDHEPHLALFVSNDDPLLFYKAIIAFAVRNLKPNGSLFFEINETKGNDLKEFLVERGFKGEIIKDLSGKDRMLKAQFMNPNS